MTETMIETPVGTMATDCKMATDCNTRAAGDLAPTSPEAMFELGMMYASDRSAPADLVRAHQWFNLAAMLGLSEAAQLRREVAAEMTDREIGQAQRAARDWFKQHPQARPSQPAPLRAAA